METVSSPATCNKRKSLASSAHEEAKRFKTEQEPEEVMGNAQRAHSPRISVPLECLRQPISVNELIELLHYAALGKTGGIKQPRYQLL